MTNTFPISEWPTTTRGFHVAHVNVQSINNKIDLVKFYVKNSQFDVFTVSETWLTNDLPTELLDVQGYDFIRLDRNWTESGRAEQELLRKEVE